MKTIEPYRLFFPLGTLFAVLGVSFWLLWSAGRMMGYPIEAHSDTMIGGFLLSFALGFLMTAVPRFTGSSANPQKSIWLILFTQILLFPLFVLGMAQEARWAMLLSLILLLTFLFRCWRTRSFDPPASFAFIGLGLFCGVAGLLMRNLGTNEGLGRLLFFQGMMGSFVLGVGGKLIPALLGWGPGPLVRIEKAVASRLEFLSSLPVMFGFVSLFFIGLFLESQGELVGGRLLRALVVTLISGYFWKLWKKPKTQGVLSWGLWLSCWAFLIGHWANCIWSESGLYAVHILYIAGMGLMTFLVATRVILSHGGHDLDLETRSPILMMVIAFILLAGLSRLALRLARPEDLQMGLMITGILWITGIVFWSLEFLPRIYRKSAR